MKKIICAVTITLLLCLAACGQSDGTDSIPLGDLMETILKDVPDMPMTMDTAIDSENFSSFLFIQPIEGAQGLASEAAIGSIAHSVVLLRLPEDVNGDAVAAEIKNNANPRKWICVEAEKQSWRKAETPYCLSCPGKRPPTPWRKISDQPGNNSTAFAPSEHRPLLCLYTLSAAVIMPAAVFLFRK